MPTVTLRRRVLRLETRTPDQLRAGYAAMTDAELEAKLAEVRGTTVAEVRRMARNSEARAAELRALLDATA